MPKGVFRRVLLFRGFAIKTPRLQNFVMGMRSNRWEREMWFHWRPQFQWRTLCPVIYADPLGFLVVMPRATQPVPQDMVDGLPDYYPNITAETKHYDYGFVGDEILALDYGLPFADAVRLRRIYYRGFQGKHAVEMPPLAGPPDRWT